MQINKSSRHSKIAGDYFESLVLYNLSKYGFECAIIDHTGIDIIARHPVSNKVFGISVKGRTRTKNRIGSVITFGINNKEKTLNACEAFNCDDAYFAICVDEENQTRIFLVSLEHIMNEYPPSKSDFRWNMSSKALKKYYNDPEVKIIKYTTEIVRW